MFEVSIAGHGTASELQILQISNESFVESREARLKALNACRVV